MGAGGVSGRDPYEEGGLIGWVTVATRASADGIEIAVTVEEQSAPAGGLSVGQIPVPAETPIPLPAASVGPDRSSSAALPLPSAGALAPGTYFQVNPYLGGDPIRNCDRGCADYRQIVFTVPAGWATSDGLVYKHLDQPGEVTFSAWTVDHVYADPCHWRGSALSPLDISHTHLSGAFIYLDKTDGGLTNQAGRNASGLTQVTLGGQVALKIELSVPAQLNLSSCDRGEFRSWSEWSVVDGANAHNRPGQLDVVYEVDVDRRPLVIDSSHMPQTSDADLAELRAILGSMIVDRGPGWATPSPSGG